MKLYTFKSFIKKIDFKKKLKKIKKLKNPKILIAWNRGLGDIPLGLYSIIKVIKQTNPSSQIASHTGYDAYIHFGIDINGNKELDKKEYTKGLNFKLRYISDEEYEYCVDLVDKWKLRVMSYGDFEIGAENVAKFMGYSGFDTYDSVESEILDYAPDPNYKFGLRGYDQRNGLGCKNPGLTNSTVKRYTYNSENDASIKIKKSSEWKVRIRKMIKSLNMVDWYNNNPGATTKRFAVESNESISFGAGDDFHLGIGYTNAESKLFIFTRLDTTTGKPIVYRMNLTGNLNDLYDWQTDGGDQITTILGIDIWGLGHLSRIQTSCPGKSSTRGLICVNKYYMDKTWEASDQSEWIPCKKINKLIEKLTEE